MALNRILGNILSDNLERSANLSFNSTLLFLDVGEHRVGVNTDIPRSTFDVGGVLTANTIVIGNITIPDVGDINVGNNIITNLATPIANSDAATKQYVDSLANGVVGSNLQFNNTTISTVFTSSNITMVPTGTGNLIVAGTGNISGKNLTLTGYIESNSVSTSANITAGRYFIGDGSKLTNLNLGNITYTNVIPNLDVTYYLGNTNRRWREAWVNGNVNAGYFVGDGGYLTNVNIGLGNISGNIIPSQNVVYSLGNSTNQWKELWVSGNTIYINSVPLSAGPNNVLFYDGNQIVSTNSGGNTNIGDLNVANVANIANAVISEGNVTANFFIGDGSFLSNLNISNAIGGYGNSNVANYLPVYSGDILANNISANSMSLGGTFAYTYSANTSSTSTANIVSVAINSFNSFNFNVTATDLTGNNCQVLKIIAATINGIMNYSEYGVVSIGNTIGTFDVTLSNSNLVLSVTPATSNLVEYSILVSNYL